MSTGLDPVLLPLTFVFLVLPTIGIIGNGVMVVATFKAKRMNSPCHILIALTCFVDLFHEIGQYPFVYHFLRSTSIMQTDCFWIQLIPMIGACAGSPLILSLGLDRFIAIRLPSKYRFLQTMPHRYVLCHMLIPLAYTLYIMITATLSKGETLVQCSIPQAFGGAAFGLLNQIGFGINVAIVAVYGLSFLLLRRSRASAKMAMAFKSIFVTVSIVICGWMVTFLVNSLAVVVSQNAYIIMVINMYAGITVNIGTMSNVFVFVAINTEYREVIQQMFGFRPHAKKMSEVSTMQGLSEKSRSKGIVAVHS